MSYNSRCFCHACHNGGDSTALVAQLFSLTMMESAAKLNADFKLGLDMSEATKAVTVSEKLQARQAEQNRRAEFNRQWGVLCDVIHEADQRLSQFPDNDATWDNPDFLNALKARTIADQCLDIMKSNGEDAI